MTHKLGTKLCEVEGCNAVVESNGGRYSARPFALSTRYCRKHLRWLEETGSLDAPKFARGSKEERFWRYVDKRGEDECWNWTADCSRGGYGSMWDNDNRKNCFAHRYSYELHHGSIESGHHVMHSCDNKRCVNPKHLSQGTPARNTNDAIDRGLRPACAIPVKFGEANPKSKLTLEQVKYIREHPEMGHKQLGDMWGLSPNCIRGVRIGRTWRTNVDIF